MYEALLQQTNYLIILSGCIYGLTIGLAKLDKKEITRIRYYLNTVVPIVLGLTFEIFSVDIFELCKLLFEIVKNLL